MKLFRRAPNIEQLKNKRDISGLVNLLNSETDENLRLEAVRALIEIGQIQAIGPLIACLRDPNKSVVKAAMEGLSCIGIPAVEPLINCLTDNNPQVRLTAITLLGSIGDRRAVMPLLTCIRDMDIRIQDASTEALISIGDTSAVPPLITILKDEDVLVRQAAVRLLGRLGDERSIKPLTHALKDEHVLVREAAAEALDTLGWESEADEMGVTILIAKRQWDKCVKLGTKAVQPLIKALNDTDWDVRQSAARSLGQIGDSSALEPLTKTLNDRNKIVLIAAAEALGYICDGRAIQPLIATLEHKDWDARQSAAEALVKLYRAGKLTTTQKHSILAVRETITQPHRDLGSDPDSNWGYHQDHGIGVRF